MFNRIHTSTKHSGAPISQLQPAVSETQSVFQNTIHFMLQPFISQVFSLTLREYFFLVSPVRKVRLTFLKSGQFGDFTPLQSFIIATRLLPKKVGNVTDMKIPQKQTWLKMRQYVWSNGIICHQPGFF